MYVHNFLLIYSPLESYRWKQRNKQKKQEPRSHKIIIFQDGIGRSPGLGIAHYVGV